jgi:probable selenium-dependent hydroxylase accessory protein YqeC
MDIKPFFPLARGMLSFVGGGGKTSLMFALATQLAARGNRVLVTTTTAIFHPDRDLWHYDRLVLGRELFCCVPEEGQLVVAAKAHDPVTQKLRGYSPEILAEIREKNSFDYILVEADGSRRLPVKAPADHEPVIPGGTDLMIGCIGLDCLGRPMDERTVHRPERFGAITGQRPGEPILADHLVMLVASDLGLFKNAGKHMGKMVVFNKADTPKLVQQGQALAERVLGECPVDNCWVACLRNPADPVIFGRTND